MGGGGVYDKAFPKWDFTIPRDYLALFYINTFLKEYFLHFDLDFKYEYTPRNRLPRNGLHRGRKISIYFLNNSECKRFGPPLRVVINEEY